MEPRQGKIPFWKFKEPDEEAYGLYMRDKDLASLRLTLYCVIITAITFLFIDYFRHTRYEYVLMFRGSLLPLSFGILWATYKFQLKPHHIQFLVLLVLYSNFTAFTILGIVGEMPNFYLPNTIPLLLYMGMSVTGVRYRYATYFNVIVFVVFIGVAYGFKHAYYVSQIPNVGINFLLCSIGGAFIERNKREGFLNYMDLLRQKLQLDEFNQQKNKIISILSHDISSPLISLSSLFSMYKNKHISPEEVESFMPEIETRLNKANFLVHNLVRWSKSQMDGFKPEFKLINLNGLVAENVNLFEAQAVEKGITFNVNLKAMYEVNGDHEMINLIIRNLLSNAVKFSYPNEVIHIQGLSNEQKVLLCISNKGKAVEKQLIDKLFSYQIKPQMGTSKERGTGLGLAIAQHFAQLNSGRIFYKSDPENAEVTMFCLELKSA